ncbi:metalloregulator ArsR/SmtB family transcription factor [Paenibacillus sp. JX-17]|uniref:Metalloregulator ArsR/SmtB family transcription factor n=2 Tax=Paenibacillus lacisoli TaxID=3064525 RepID=A0ABT9CAQ2_9BACL|nr:metalloregulator ArsR/SmtB family transcription factor [Paenibacillus sp. JX-17]MDO7906334.1 metalloregulator ArsR/SmtB family transcription factor [Paenibacillus sp. JX-17]
MFMESDRPDVFRAVADPTRRSILGLLIDRELPVNEISGHYNMSRTAVSKHLGLLSEAGLVKKRKVGREIRYRLEPEPLRELQRWLSYYERFWDNRLSVLQRYVEEGASVSEASATAEIHAGLCPSTDQGE